MTRRLLGLTLLTAVLVVPARAQLKPLPPFEPPARGGQAPWSPGYTAGSDRPFGRIHMPVELPRHRHGFPEAPSHWDFSRDPAYEPVGPGRYVSYGRHPYVMPDLDPPRTPEEQDVNYRGFPEPGLERMTMMRKSVSEFAFEPDRPWALGGVRGQSPYRGPGGDPGYIFPRPSWYVNYAGLHEPPPQHLRGRMRTGY